MMKSKSTLLTKVVDWPDFGTKADRKKELARKAEGRGLATKEKERYGPHRLYEGIRCEGLKGA